MPPAVFLYAVVAFVILWFALGAFFWVVFRVIRNLDERAKEYGPYEGGL